MPSSLVPLSQIQDDRVKEYLVRQGIAPEIVEWKYFDKAFNRGRERGQVLLRDGRVSGFLGAIPFTMQLGGREIPTAWSCDWSSDPDAGAAGLLLVKEMLKAYDPYFQLGGNDNTLRIMPRLASFTATETGVLMVAPLRFGGLLRIARRRVPRIPLDGSDLLNRMPVLLAPGRHARRRVDVEPGLSPRLACVLGDCRDGACRPRYSYEYLEWQIGRCPGMECATVLLRSQISAAALCWTQRPGGAAWRVAPWAPGGGPAELEAVLDGALRHIYEAGGESVSVLVSRVDSALLALLRSKRFLMAPRRRMFCVVASTKSAAFEEPTGLSLLDTDMAYRFE